MKIRVTLKDPDTLHDSASEAFNALPKPDGVSAAEWALLRESRRDEAVSAISSGWMQYGEYLTVEFDLVAKTARVVERGEQE